MPVYATEAGLLTAIVTILAILLYSWMGFNVGRMRGRHNVPAPAVTGAPEFERAMRIHYNTLEALPVFFVLLWLATLYFRSIGWLPALIGLVWVIGRFLYMTGYMKAPEKRELGFMIAAIAQLALLILTIIGIVMTWSAVTAT